MFSLFFEEFFALNALVTVAAILSYFLHSCICIEIIGFVASALRFYFRDI
jgi:hypothetical protein